MDDLLGDLPGWLDSARERRESLRQTLAELPADDPNRKQCAALLAATEHAIDDTMAAIAVLERAAGLSSAFEEADDDEERERISVAYLAARAEFRAIRERACRG